jgi:uncharacterized RDD family membrane protein YckC
MTTGEARARSPLPAGAARYQGLPAGIVTRLVANAVDGLVVLLIIGLVYGVVAGFLFLLHPHSFEFPSSFGWTIPVIGFWVAAPYFALAWYTTGRTYGDVLLGLRVVDNSGRRLGLIRSLLRATFCVAFPLGLLWVAISSNNHSVQDVVVRTSVRYDWRPENPLTG